MHVPSLGERSRRAQWDLCRRRTRVRLLARREPMGEDCNYSWDDARLKSRRLPGLYAEMGPAPAHRRHRRQAQHVNQFALLPVHPKNLLNRHGPPMFLETMVRTYEEARVSQGEKAAHIAALVAALTYRRKGLGKPLTKIGHFTGLVDSGSYALSLCTDSVATKVLGGQQMRKLDSIRTYCVATNVHAIIGIRSGPRALRRATVHGMAHITGGGVRNLVRLKSNVEFRISDPLEPPSIFRALAQLGGIESSEMYQTFNMGMGFALVAAEEDAKDVIRSLRPDVKARVVGSVFRGKGVTVPPLGLSWSSY